MGRKCCVYGCKTGYKSQEDIDREQKISLYRLPDDESEKKAWISAIPNANLKVTKNTAVCGRHWPPDFETITKNGKKRPKQAPSVWPNVPASQVPTAAPTPRPTKRALCFERNKQEDEIDAFLERDNVSFSQLRDKLFLSQQELDLPAPVISSD